MKYLAKTIATVSICTMIGMVSFADGAAGAFTCLIIMPVLGIMWCIMWCGD